MRNNKRQLTRQPETRSLKIQPKTRFNRYSQKDVPELTLCGNWLQDAGFQSGATVAVTTLPNLLIITTT